MTDIIAPHPFGSEVTASELIKLFSSKTQWEERYRELVLLSRQLPSLTDELKQPDFEVKGCENRVWLNYQLVDGQYLHFYGDSEGRIIKGLLAVLFTFVEGLTATQILSIDPTQFYQQLGILDKLSSSRIAGLSAIIARVKTIAQLVKSSQAS